MILYRLFPFMLALVLGVAAPVLAQERAGRPQAGAEQKGPSGPGVLALRPADSVTGHTLDIRGVQLAYTATAGTLNLYEQSRERSAASFYTSYVQSGAAG